MKIMVVDAQEPSEPQTYIIDTDDTETEAPRHMLRMISRSSVKCFEHIMNDGPEAMSGLVNEDSEEADQRVEEVWEYLNSNCTPENKFRPGVVAYAYISIAQC
jgi:hypothetical protein